MWRRGGGGGGRLEFKKKKVFRDDPVLPVYLILPCLFLILVGIIMAQRSFYSRHVCIHMSGILEQNSPVGRLEA